MKLMLLLFALLFSACAREESVSNHALHFAQGDEELLEISLSARESFPLFLEKLQNPALDERDFRVKHPFLADRETGFTYEHLWLEQITVQDGLFYGMISNQPRYISTLNLGDFTFFDPSTISDWMYIKDGRIIGGNSVKYLIGQIPQSEWDASLRRYFDMFE